MAPTTTLVPPRRLGALLRQARLATGSPLEEYVVTSGLSVVELDDIEHGRGDLDESILTALVAAYGIPDAAMVPERSRLVIDLDEGRIACNHGSLGIDATGGPDATAGPDAILARYLALVYRLRDLPLGTPLPLRDIDVEVLSAALELASTEVERRLRHLIREESAVARDQRRIRRQLLLPLVGVLVAATSIGTVVLVAQPDDPRAPVTGGETVGTGAPRIATPAIEVADPIDTDLGDGGAVEINPDP